jgi:hypothetical protein
MLSLYTSIPHFTLSTTAEGPLKFNGEFFFLIFHPFSPFPLHLLYMYLLSSFISRIFLVVTCNYVLRLMTQTYLKTNYIFGVLMALKMPIFSGL